MALLTKRERVLRTIRFQETDRVPVYDLLQNDPVIEHYSGEAATPENGVRVKAHHHRQDDGHDPRASVGRTSRARSWRRTASAPAASAGPPGSSSGPGMTCRAWSSGSKARSRRVEAQVFDRAYVEAFHRHIREWLAINAAADPTGRGDPTVLIVESGAGLTQMYHVTDIGTFSFLIADYPDLVEEWLDANNRAQLRRVAAIADPELIPIVLTYDDIAYKTSTIFSPKWLRRYWCPG